MINPNYNKVHFHITFTNEEVGILLSALLARQIRDKDLLTPRQKSLIHNMVEYLEEVEQE